MQIDFHTFSMGDVDDPELYAAEPIWKWQQTDQGQWAMKNAQNLAFHRESCVQSWGHRFVIRGEVQDPKKITEYFLRWPKP